MLGLCMLTCNINAQTDKPTKSPRLVIRDVFTHFGFNSVNNPKSGLNDFRTLAPNSKLLKNDLSNFEINNRKDELINPIFLMQLGVQFRKKGTTAYRSNPLLRMGFNYTSGSVINFSLSQQSSQIADTLTSSQTGQQYFVDSIFRQDFDMQLTSQRLQFDASLIFITIPTMRLSVYSGLGFNLGTSINSTIDIQYNEDRYNNSKYEKMGSSNTSSTNKNKGESFNSGRISNYSIYTPFGLDFRIGKTDDFFSIFHLFYEIRTGLQVSNVNKLRVYNSPFFQINSGIRVNWN